MGKAEVFIDVIKFSVTRFFVVISDGPEGLKSFFLRIRHEVNCFDELTERETCQNKTAAICSQLLNFY